VAAVAVTKDWAFDSAAYATADTALFAAAYTAAGDNGIKITGGDVAVDGLIFNSTAASVIRYRPAGSTNNATATAVWNTNGAFFSNNTTLIPVVGSDLPTNVRTYIAIPVTSGTAFTITLNYKQTSTTAATGKIALVGSDGKVLAVKDAHKDTAAATGDTLTVTVPAGHTQTSVKIIYGREAATGGGVNITSMQRVQ
jgi:archaellum component FlaF (FlaF/FlaG flagellin family)